jgi:hypothetical protein
VLLPAPAVHPAGPRQISRPGNRGHQPPANVPAVWVAGRRPGCLDRAEEPDLRVRACYLGIARYHLVPEVGDGVPSDRDLAFLRRLPDEGMRPVQVSQVPLPAGEQELTLMHAILDEHAADIVGQPAMHLPNGYALGYGAVTPGEHSPLRAWHPGSREEGHTRIENPRRTASQDDAQARPCK